VVIRTALLCGGIAMGSAMCFASEMVCLKSGFCLKADSHDFRNQNLSLRVGSGEIELPSAAIASIQTLSGSPVVTRTSPEPEKPRDDPEAVIGKAAEAEGVDRDFLRSVARIESDFRQESVSSKGAIGLMQIMPSTAKDLHVDPTQERENALGGAKYLRMLLLRYRGNSALALAAYNAGPGAVQRYAGVPPYKETRSYIVKVTREYDQLRLKSAPSDVAVKRPSAKD
jgi:soluble lytic murein transglycosylase-like protein